jgi:fibrillarin-like rRNA methylase
MVDFIVTQDLATHNQMQLISKHNGMYNNGNKLTINLKTSSSKPNSKNKFVIKKQICKQK